MNEIAIIIPSRLDAERLPGKPLKLINKKEMILHVYDAAHKADIGQVYVATPDQQIYDLLEKSGRKAFITKIEHQTGTDRIYEVFKDKLNQKPEIIINLQGDMPNINYMAIRNLADHMKKKTCEIGTLASELNIEKEASNPNVVKLVTNQIINEKNFSEAVDFFRLSEKPLKKLTYHHIGIYAFTNKALIRYVGLKRSKLELERKLEQLRALENKMKIDVGYTNFTPLSVDTLEDYLEIKKNMESNE